MFLLNATPASSIGLSSLSLQELKQRCFVLPILFYALWRGQPTTLSRHLFTFINIKIALESSVCQMMNPDPIPLYYWHKYTKTTFVLALFSCYSCIWPLKFSLECKRPAVYSFRRGGSLWSYDTNIFQYSVPSRAMLLSRTRREQDYVFIDCWCFSISKTKYWLSTYYLIM